eukprot:s1460_g1.t1
MDTHLDQRHQDLLWQLQATQAAQATHAQATQATQAAQAAQAAHAAQAAQAAHAAHAAQVAQAQAAQAAQALQAAQQAQQAAQAAEAQRAAQAAQAVQAAQAAQAAHAAQAAGVRMALGETWNQVRWGEETALRYSWAGCLSPAAGVLSMGKPPGGFLGGLERSHGSPALHRLVLKLLAVWLRIRLRYGKPLMPQRELSLAQHRLPYQSRAVRRRHAPAPTAWPIYMNNVGARQGGLRRWKELQTPAFGPRWAVRSTSVRRAG